MKYCLMNIPKPHIGAVNGTFVSVEPFVVRGSLDHPEPSFFVDAAEAELR